MSFDSDDYSVVIWNPAICIELWQVLLFRLFSRHMEAQAMSKVAAERPFFGETPLLCADLWLCAHTSLERGPHNHEGIEAARGPRGPRIRPPPPGQGGRAGIRSTGVIAGFVVTRAYDS